MYSCQKSNKPSYSKKENSKAVVHPGKKLMETKCYVCHNPSTKHDERIAPPMIAIKKHYLNKDITKKQFIASIQNWIKNPRNENAKMKGAVKKFGLMPQQYFSEETIQQIGDYMFTNEIETPKSFQKHQLGYEEKGLKYALATKAVLGKNLIGKIQKEGTLEALAFCNVNALSLTDSVADNLNVNIKRVSDKPRNPKNKANEEELSYINIFKKEILDKKTVEPIVVEKTDKVHVYYPIKTNGMCLQCHGNPKDQIKPTTFSEIKKLYPLDKAVGYNINEVRGIWNVTFNK